MNADDLKVLLEAIRSGSVSIDDGLEKLRHLPFESTGYANIDHHRALRCGVPEVIFCPGKTKEQVAEIFAKLAAHKHNVLATRADEDIYEAVAARTAGVEYEKAARAIVLRQEPVETGSGHIALVTAGTGDIPVAEEARVTAELLNQPVRCIYDVGVAGIHRLLNHCREIQSANAVIVAAGMEGALASVVGGLAAAPVIAVPTSIGYGASFGGVAALLAMLNSCAAGVSVVNIDNGFAAGYSAAMINRLAMKTD